MYPLCTLSAPPLSLTSAAIIAGPAPSVAVKLFWRTTDELAEAALSSITPAIKSKVGVTSVSYSLSALGLASGFSVNTI